MKPHLARLRAALGARAASRRLRVAAGAALGVLVLSAVAVLVLPVPHFADYRAAMQHGSEALLLDRDGQPIERLRLDAQRRVLEWTPLADVSPALRAAVLAAEDKRFYLHPGVDPLGLLSAAWDNLRAGRARGASTLTMQLATIMLEAAEPGRARRGLAAKLAQMRLALALEVHWTKREIFEAYLNAVPFRGELAGVAAASFGLFAKGPAGLDAAESAVLAALLRSPSAPRAAVARRACDVLRAASAPDACARARVIAAGLPRRPYPMPGLDFAPHLARRLLTTPGETRRVALDGDLQRFAGEALRNRLAELQARNVEDGAVIVLDNRSGEVLAYVGSSGDLSGAPAVDGAAAQRQPGSTLKPFLYGLALERGYLNAASVLDDSPLALATPRGLYAPQDYDPDYKGAVSVRTALAASLNVPAVRTLALVGTGRFLEHLRALGMSSLQRDAEHYGYALALGGAETDLLTLTNAYRALANGGEWSPWRFEALPAGADPAPVRRVLSREAAFVVADMLADAAARAPTFGLASPLSTHGWAAVKTGTSKAMRDNWAVGFTDRYTVGVWVGNYSGAPMWDVSGITGAAPVWHDLIEYLHAGRAARAPAPPAGVARRLVQYQPEIEAAREEWFIAARADQAATPGAVPVLRVVLNTPDTRPRLLAPADGSVIAPDPDIPRARQSLLVHASVPGACLRLDGVPLARCGVSRLFVPLPAPGRHRIELLDAAGKPLDTHGIEVRPIVPPRRNTSVDRAAGNGGSGPSPSS
ncbi:MAG: penicillin-binding protein 1C [Rhodocyclaceae bacterium]|nr:penicillin-binding protein 1C [Rhodocyclaceae bacterium]